jgi:hypothetical protein
MISERTLKQWRREALKLLNDKELCASLGERPVVELNERILRLTQELSDILLVRK